MTAARRVADEMSWASDHKFRRHCLEQLQAALRKEAPEFQKLVTAEAGVASSVIVTHVDAMIDGMDFWNELTTSFQWEEDLGPYELMGMRSDRRIRYEPYGVVGAITPWNAPFMTAIWKVSHSMATGNTVVLKSAPDTPLTAAKMAQVISESTDVPPGVVNMISSEDKAIAGDALTGDPRVDMFHFTGSPGVGQRIMERAANGIRHVVLELGGKSGNLLLPDADLDMASGLGVAMCMSSSGQGCAATRMLVHADIYDEVLQRLEAMSATCRGETPPIRPMWWARSFGPSSSIAWRPWWIARRRRVPECCAAASVATGAARGSGMSRQWSPVSTKTPRSPNTRFSVRCSRWSDTRATTTRRCASPTTAATACPRTCSRATRNARGGSRIGCGAGTVNINNSFYLSPDAPFSGWGISGVGSEHGVAGFRDYLRTKTVASPAE